MLFAHTSVLPEESLSYWVTDPQGVYIDATLGAGGHTARLLERFPKARVIGIDQDPDALAAAKQRLEMYGDRFQAVHGNFRDMADLLQGLDGSGEVLGVLMDLGVSSYQFDNAERGFSYQADAPLDMRMDPNNTLTAFRLVNMKPADEITEALQRYGEERWASRIADFIVNARKSQPIRTTDELVEVIKAAIPAAARRKGGHPARRTFQALRIWVNDELGALQDGLEQSLHVVKPAGRVVAISFHSLEDRIVKQTFRRWHQEEQGDILTRHPVIPSDTEIAQNSRSRSAKLRAFSRRA
ncbi:MAG: 16S rRNA (cytosine(1402)-N(4))-methyltransferase RsmH [Firmicutes bacterium]|nr:16S rRNA (cytosine(1402)-N(4))-methyltransferase RsmH [Bacillota bacterium]